MKNFSYLVIAAIIFGTIFTSCNKPDDNVKEFTVFFETGEGGSIVAPQKVMEGEKVIRPDNPTHSGYLFVGWYKEVEMINEWKFDVHIVTCDVTLYAKWVEWTIEDDPLYPTTIYSLPEEILLQMRNDFAQRNPNVYTSLNQFGFCAMLTPGGGNGVSGGFTKEEAIAAVKEFVTRNPEYTGVSNPDDLQFKSISSTVGYNNALFWHFRTRNQTINNIEVDCTEILFHTQNWKLIRCYGNHYPDVYVPTKFNFNVEQAKSLLLGKEIIHWGWGGQYSAGIVTVEHLQQSTTKLIIVPVTTDEKIELRVVWQVYLNGPLHYIFEIDVMTGETIREMPTIIS